MIIDGKKIAAEIREELRVHIAEHGGRRPGLAAILVGDNPASESYVATKRRAAEGVGIESHIFRFPADLPEEKLIQQIDTLNQDSAIDGILVQLPLPDQMDVARVMLEIDPRKDVDGFHPVNMGKLLVGDETGFVPCTPAGILELLTRSGVSLEGKHVVIVGRSNIVGKPLASLLLRKRPECNATVTVAHSRTKNLPKLCAAADVLVAAMGHPRFIHADMVKQGAVVIDVGISRVDGKLVGDVAFDEVASKCSQITPVPGGVGPMTVAMLLRNTWTSYLNWGQASH